MSDRSNFAQMPIAELRAYVLQHRHDEEALHIFLDRLHAEKQPSRAYGAAESVADAIAEYLNSRQHP